MLIIFDFDGTLMKEDLHIGLFSWVNIVIPILAGRHRLAILTNRHRKSAQKYLGRFEKYFELVIGGEDVKELKPSSEGIQLILKGTGAKKKETLIIGDMPDDILAGKSAGIKTGAVKWGLGDWDELMAYLPDYSFEEYEHLLQI